MGYTHYYRIPKEMDSKRFNALVKDVKLIITVAKFIGIELASGNGKRRTKPKVTKDVISFNGVEEDSHETMLIQRIEKDGFSLSREENGLIFNFCKTARKDYDTIVVAVLVALKKHFPESEISSDGDMEEFLKGSMEGQKGGLTLCKELFGKGYVKDFKLGD